MDVCLLIKSRLEELGLEQKDLAAAAEVTESYVSQLLNRKKLPPAPDRTDIYEKIESILKLSSGKLAKLAHSQRIEQLRQGFENPPGPLFRETRELVLRKCAAETRQRIWEIFERQPFGELERFITQKLLDMIRVSPGANRKRAMAPQGRPSQRPKLQADPGHDPGVPGHGCIQRFSRELRLVPETAA